MSDADTGQQRITLFHLFNGPGQNGFRFSHVRDHGVHQVRKLSIAAELNHLGVNHQHADLIRSTGHQDGRDDGIQTNTFTCPGSTCDQEVRHFGKVNHHGIAGDVLAQEDRNVHAIGCRIGFFHDVPQANRLAFLVGNFDANGILARDRGDDPHTGHAQGDRQVIGEAGDLAQSQARFEFNFVLRNHRPGFNFNHANVKPKIGKGRLKHFGFATHFGQLFFVVNFITAV